MHKFYTLSTDSFVPISHDNKHLFNTYELVNNFIRTRIATVYRNILAKPILHNYEVDWYSPFDQLRETTDLQAQRQYFAFKDELQKHIQSLAQSPDPNNKNWAGLLEKVFSEKDNKIFSNGQQICIVWGWAFNNDQIQRPIIAEEKEEIPEVQPVEEPLVIEETLAPEELPIAPEEVPQPVEEEKVIDFEPEPVVEQPKKRSFLEFLKEFAAHRSWLLVFLLVLIALTFFIKSLMY